ncbi:MAG TPA: response regulator [Acidiferrobacterales bacterium]|nr:response regulator [Acidiferrobacterales bacterium]
MRLNNNLSNELLFLRAKATKYAFYGVLIAGLSVVFATLLVSYVMQGNISLDGIMLGQKGHVVLWTPDNMPFFFVAWGQLAIFNENRKQSFRVLLAEDSIVNREIMQYILTKFGCITEVATDGEEAVSAVRKTHYDLILMDLHMPRMDGLAAVAAIRALPDNRGQIPIIVLTAGLSEQEKQRFHAHGVNDVVIKPIDIVKLKEAITRLGKYQTPPSSLFNNTSALDAT